MSSTEIYVKMERCRKWELIGCARNAMNGAFKIWLEMEKKYLPPLEGNYYRSMGMCLDEEKKELWNLPCDKSYPMTMDERFVFFTTFDRVMVASEDVPSLIKALRSIGERCDTNHSEQADIIETFYNNNKGKKFHIAWNQTSVCCERDKFGSNMDAPLKKFTSINIERINEFIK